MRNLLNGVVFIGVMILAVIGLSACSGSYTSPHQLPSSARLGASFYTQVGMFYEKGRYRTTNYGVGTFIPVNTEVKLVEFGEKTLTVEVAQTGDSILVENVPRFTGWTMAEAFETLFATEKVSLFKFDAQERKNIEQGSIQPGMSKAAVIVARGYPPSHETPSLERDQWKFWKNRWDTIIVSFRNDRVVDIKN
ncbi:MAG: hypothetical protein ACRER2_07690 [Methylococcales bacterium]